MKFVIRIYGTVLNSYNENLAFVSLNNDFFSTIVNDKVFSDCVLEVDDDAFDINTLNKIVVEIKRVGKFYFYYYKNDLLNDIIENIQELRLIDSSQNESANDKVKKLITLTSNKYLSFVVFYGCVKGHNINKIISSFYQDKYTHLFIIKQKYIDEEILNKKTILQLLILYPYRWLVILLSGTVMFLALLLGITFIYYGNLIATVVLFVTFLFSLVGLSIGNCDIYRKNKKCPIAKELIMCTVADIISVSSGLGLFVLVFILIKKDDVFIPLFQITGFVSMGVFIYLFLFNLFCFRKKQIKTKNNT